VLTAVTTLCWRQLQRCCNAEDDYRAVEITTVANPRLLELVDRLSKERGEQVVEDMLRDWMKEYRADRARRRERPPLAMDQLFPRRRKEHDEG